MVFLNTIEGFLSRTLQPILRGRDVHPEEVSQIAVCGRGPSLRYIHELKDLDNFIIVNDFSSELSDTIIYNTLREKNIIHFVNRQEQKLPLKHLLKLNIVRYQLRMLKSNKGDLRWYESRRPDARIRDRLKTLGASFLPEDMEEVLNEEFTGNGIVNYTDTESDLNNTGMLAILFAAHYYDPDDVFCVGFDFYELTDYYAKDKSKEQKRYEEQKEESVKTNMLQIANLYPEIEFHIITAANFHNPPSNLNIYHREILDNL